MTCRTTTPSSRRYSPTSRLSPPIAVRVASTVSSSWSGFSTWRRKSSISTAPRSGAATFSRRTPFPSITRSSTRTSHRWYYDSGNYEPILDKALEMIGYRRVRRRRRNRACAPRASHVGIGVVAYVEGTGIGPYEGARVQIHSERQDESVATGIGTQGQGHFTVLGAGGRRAAGRRRSTDIHVVTGDTDQFHWGSRHLRQSRRRGGGQCRPRGRQGSPSRRPWRRRPHECSRSMRTALELADGRGAASRACRTPSVRSPSANSPLDANPLRGTVEPGTEPGLEATSYFGPFRGATASGVHAMIVEVDRETFDVDIRKYVVVHDCGNIINPLILDGQIHGGVAQGIGNAFYEQLVYDAGWSAHESRRSWTTCCPPHSTCRTSKATTRRPAHRSTRSASRAPARPEPSPSARCSPRPSKTLWPAPASRSSRSR